MTNIIEIEINENIKSDAKINETTHHEFSEETLEKFHKIFGHISEFPHIDPSVNIVVNEDDYMSEMEKNERI